MAGRGDGRSGWGGVVVGEEGDFMNHPTNHQELFEGYIRGAVRLLHEFSGDTRLECRRLQRWAIRYGVENGVFLPATDDEFGIYYEDDEQDAEIAARLEGEG